MKTLMTTAIFTSAMALSTQTLGNHSSPYYVAINSIGYAGTGCPAGSVSETISPDGKAVNLIFDAFVAEIGHGVRRSEARKNCNISIDLSYPKGWSYTIDEGQVSGYVDLDYDVTGKQITSYYFQGQANSAMLSASFYGPTSRDYLVHDDLGPGEEVWSPCGSQRALQINLQARLSSRSRYASGLMTINGPQGRDLKLKWRRC